MPAPPWRTLLKILLGLGLLSGCRSARVAFQFQPTARAITSDTTTERPEPAVASAAPVPLLSNKTAAEALRVHHSAQAAVAVARSRTLGKRPALRRQLCPRIHHSTERTAGFKPSDSDYGITPFTVALVLLLVFSLLFIGIPLLLAAQFSIAFWAALGYWLLAIAVVALYLCREMIIDAIGDLFRSEEKKQERYRQGKY